MVDPLTKTHVNTIGCKITVRISEALRNNEFPDEELPELCAYITVALRDINNQEELLRFLVVLSARWPFLNPVTEEISKDVSTLTQIEEAFAKRTAPQVQ